MADEKRTPDKEPQSSPMSRRTFLKNSGMVAGGVVGGSLLGGLFMNDRKNEKEKKEEKTETTTSFQEARIFFTREEDFRALEAATECIFPEDHHGSGAIGLGVPYFIDKQLAGDWGINARDYRKGPFKVYEAGQLAPDASTEAANPKPVGASSQGEDPSDSHLQDQSILTRREIFTYGLRALNSSSQDQYKKPYYELEEDQQIDLLHKFEEGKAKMKGVPSSVFFALLRQATLEGAYSDPIYGGNKNMEGWKMRNYPGAYPSYMGLLEKDEFAELKPVALKDTQHH
ncbi:gluconate 2-dehydrogenase subunit 3 family protein [Sporosarcina trichiuri]|uniref:gluconate 2-dehydrogenase subunit 3 family protein n=1 Tax=Sporosarcina trichiuri TaxID=3056445 RepID=UPI0025B450DD|nr:gluconate 2-dehydrogenase subunit 3 family protein [Sporosarcina sp. 0.2-SM1T-5]WJY26312.1 gluconate 2-dehydrogenase subunit 3 family protein [Sporosarcina sp. 0.2-SM1T-5]